MISDTNTGAENPITQEPLAEEASGRTMKNTKAFRFSFLVALVAGLVACQGGYQLPEVADAGNDAAPAVDAQQPQPDSGPVCAAPRSMCGTACVDTATDGANCGGCNNVCGAGNVCRGGECVNTTPADAGVMPPPADVQQPSVDNGPRCDAPTTLCGSACCNLATDVANCGSCGNRCATGQSCVAGTCRLVCPTGQTACGSTCVDTMTNGAHCGACGTSCGTGACMGGTCLARCDAPRSQCTSGCTDTRSDVANCGYCGRACAAGQSCVAGSCQVVCAAGYTACGTVCMNLQSDVANCGSCGNRCTAGSTCVSGSCTPPACVASACPARPNSNAACVSNSCSFTCYTSYGNCDGVAGNGCETALTTDANCGSCGRVCTGGTRCESGACVLTPAAPARYLRAQRPGAFVCVWDLNADPVSAMYCSSSLGGQLRVNTVGAYWPGNHIRAGLALDNPLTTPSDRVRWIQNDIGLLGSSARTVGYTTLQFETESGSVTEHLLDVAQSCVDVCHPSYPGWRETKVTIRTRPSASTCPTTCDGR